MHTSLELLLQPFAWIGIPAGKVKVISIVSKEGRGENYIPPGTSQIFDVSAFEIAKYPVTNAQFAKFVEAGGYIQRQWWTDEGWQQKEQNQWTEPLYWQDSKWNKLDYPVVGVSYYEAIAFCQWLSVLTEERISLPSEQQWQHAAQGDTEWLYAWGPAYDRIDRCNWNAEGIIPDWNPKFDVEGTNSVTKYEGKGDSPFGVVDMNGNVWEWCRTKFVTGENDLDGVETRITRGGGWVLMYSYEVNLGNIDRMDIRPSYRENHIGFRCIRYLSEK